MHNIDLQEEELNFTVYDPKNASTTENAQPDNYFFKAPTSIAIILKLMNEHAMKNFRYISNS